MADIDKINDLMAISGGKYNNSNNNNKRNKRNNELSPTSLCPTSSSASPLKDTEQQLDSQRKDFASTTLPEEKDSSSADPSFAETVKRAPVHFWDNGPKSRRRYKFTITCNLENGMNIEFIASMNKHLQDFKRNIPEECHDEICNWATMIRSELKTAGITPYLGKFRRKIPYVAGKRSKKTSAIEPWTAIVLWWDPEEKYWQGVLRMSDFEFYFSLATEYLTRKQVDQGCKGYDLYKNPKFEKKKNTYF